MRLLLSHCLIGCKRASRIHRVVKNFELRVIAVHHPKSDITSKSRSVVGARLWIWTVSTGLLAGKANHRVHDLVLPGSRTDHRTVSSRSWTELWQLWLLWLQSTHLIPTTGILRNQVTWWMPSTRLQTIMPFSLVACPRRAFEVSSALNLLSSVPDRQEVKAQSRMTWIGPRFCSSHRYRCQKPSLLLIRTAQRAWRTTGLKWTTPSMTALMWRSALLPTYMD